MDANQLAGRDYAVLVDKSGSMSTAHKGNKTRWQAAQEQTEAVARECAKFDPDGIDVVVFAGKPKAYNNTTPDKVHQIFTENAPGGSTDTAAALQLVLDGYFTRKAAGNANPLTIVCMTDGEPDDQKAVASVIVKATQKMDADEEIGILFLQVGNDASATKFLRSLDDDLTSQGAKFDIVDCKTEDEMEDISITDALLAAVND